MTKAILLALWVSTNLFFICREIKSKDNQRSHEWWLSDLRSCMYSIERNFDSDCEKIVTDAFSKRNFSGKIVIDDYRKTISELKKDYSDNLYEKIVAQKGKYTIKTVPEHLENEYQRNIANIANTYLNFGNFMSKQIQK